MCAKVKHNKKMSQRFHAAAHAQRIILHLPMLPPSHGAQGILAAGVVHVLARIGINQ